MLLVTVASATELVSNEPLLELGVSWQPGADHRGAVSVGLAWPFVLGDTCYWTEVDCRPGPVWPITGPRAAVAWRGGSTFGLDAEWWVGAGALDVYDVGFFPVAVGYGAVGVRRQTGRPWAPLAGVGWIGAVAGPVSLRVDGRVVWDERPRPSAGVALQSATVAGELE